jgi:hypothetical protein
MIAHDDYYMKVVFDETHKIIEHTWKATSAELNDDGFKSQLVIFGDLILKHKPKGVTADTTNFLFTMAPEVQQWVAENFFPKVIEVGCKKYALQVSEDVFTQVSVENTVENEGAIHFKYFESIESAKNWVIQ